MLDIDTIIQTNAEEKHMQEQGAYEESIVSIKDALQTKAAELKALLGDDWFDQRKLLQVGLTTGEEQVW